MKIALLGTRGIPARYGGFETFAEELCARLAERFGEPGVGQVLPLTGLTVSGYGGSMAHLGQWTGLTRLMLLYVTVEDSPQQLTQQLQQLTRLSALEVLHLRFPGQPQPSLQPLVDGVVGMSSLRSLHWTSHDLHAQQEAQLRGMAQLTKLNLF